MKQEDFLYEIEVAIEYSEVHTKWYSIFKEFIALTLEEKDIDLKFYGYLVKFNNILIEVSNTFPLFFECGNPKELTHYLSLIEKKIKPKLPLEFLWKHLCEYLHTFKINNSNYNIEVNEVSEMVDSLLYVLEEDLNLH